MDLTNLQMEPCPNDDAKTSQARQHMLKWLIQVEHAASEPVEPDDDDDITGMTIESLIASSSSSPPVR